MTTNTESLLPCPFCGGRAEFNEHTPGCYFTKLDAVKKAHKGDVTCMVELIPAWNTRATHPAPAASAEREARVIEQNARKAAQEQLYAERERHTAEVKRLQAEIGRLKSTAASVSVSVSDVIATVRERYRGTKWGKAAECICDAVDEAIIAQRPAQAGVPEGWKLVPVEPTPEMKSAGINVEVYSEVSDSIGALTWAEVDAIYRAILAAAPKVEGGPV